MPRRATAPEPPAVKRYYQIRGSNNPLVEESLVRECATNFGDTRCIQDRIRWTDSDVIAPQS
jgi:hypothetical protein